MKSIYRLEIKDSFAGRGTLVAYFDNTRHAEHVLNYIHDHAIDGPAMRIVQEEDPDLSE